MSRPVFIVGVPRSGTTLLFRTLLLHPRFGGKPVTYESHAVEDLYGFVRGDAEPPPRLERYLGGDMGPELRALVSRLARRRTMVRRLFGHRTVAWPRAWHLAGEHHVVRAYFADVASRRDVPRLADKTPRHLHRVPHLRLAFPDAQFVCIHRHPVDVLNSYWARYARFPDHEWANVSVDELASTWAEGVAAERRWAGRLPESFISIEYEQMVRDPEVVIRRVLDFLGEPFDRACVDTFDVPATRQDDPTDSRPMSSRERHWSDHVSPESARELERLVATPLAQLGYRAYA